MDRRPKSIFWPLLLLAGGSILLLNNLGIIEVGPGSTALLRLWPLFFIIGGLDSLYRQDGFVGPVVFIGAGTFFLLSNLGYLEVQSWQGYLKFWPVLLIALGLDVLIGRRRGVLVSLLGILLGLGILGGVFLLASSVFSPGATKIETLVQPAGEIDHAIVEIEMLPGKLAISDGASRENLVEGKMAIAGSGSYTTGYKIENSLGRFTLTDQQAMVVFPFDWSNRQWDVKLAANVPIQLKTQVIFGSQSLDLRNLTLENLESETIFGQSVLTLPNDAETDISMSVVMGELVLLLPKESNLQIDLGGGLTAIHLPEGYKREGGRILPPGMSVGQQARVNLNVPMGNLRIETY